MGVPFDYTGTFSGVGENDHRWQMRVNYSPADSQVTAVRVLVVGPGIQEPLEFDQSPAANGKLDLSNVRFPEGQPHILWQAKYDRLSIVVELDGVAPDQPTTTVQGELGFGTDHGPWLLTALYDAGRIPGADARRYSGRDLNRGGDGWGRERTFGYLQTNSDLWFNDLSLEHGGPFEPDHDGHRTGLEIDVRYFGTGGNNNSLNGTADGDLGTARLGVLMDAQGGSVAAQRSIVAWIRQNRQRLDQIVSSAIVRRVLIGNALWNTRSLLLGLYPNGTDKILDPDLPQNDAWVNTWSPAKVTPWPLHLSHVHIDLHRRP